MVGHGDEPAELGGHCDERHGIGARPEHEQLRDRPQQRVQHRDTALRDERRRARRDREARALGEPGRGARRDVERDVRRRVRDDGGAGRQRSVGAVDDRCDAGALRSRERVRDRRERLVAARRLQRLQEHAQQSIAADAEAEDLVHRVAQIVGDGRGLIVRKHRPRPFREIAFEASAAHEAAIVAARRNQNSLAGLAVGRAERLIHRREHDRRARGAPRLERLNDLANTHCSRHRSSADQYASAARWLHHPRAAP